MPNIRCRLGWIVAESAEGIAAQDTFETFPSAFEWAVEAHGLKHVLRSGWGETTLATHHWAEGDTVKHDA